MSSNWVKTKWGEIATLEYGKGLRDYRSNIGGFPVYGTNGMVGWSVEPLCKHSGVIIGRKGAYRGVHYSKLPFYVIDTAFYLEPKVEMDLRWAYYELLTQDINGMDSGSAIPSTSRDSFYNLDVLLPPLEDQHRIASILGSLDDKIELNHRMNQTLEEMARTIFQSWFVNFDPVRAKAEGRDTGLPAEIADLFPDGFEESAVGEIPRGWRFSTIGEEVRVVGGSTPSTSVAAYWENGVYHWATPKDLSGLSSPILIDTERFITNEGLNQISSGLLPKGSVLLSSRAPIGYLAIANMPTAINQGFIGMVCDKVLPNVFVLLWTQENMETIKARANGTTFQEISKSNFRPISIVVPNENLIEAFASIVQPLVEKITLNLCESQNLMEIRDRLLAKLMNGEFDALGS